MQQLTSGYKYKSGTSPDADQLETELNSYFESFVKTNSKLVISGHQLVM